MRRRRRCVPARRPDHRATHADRAADCIAAGAANARWRASKRSHVAASVLHRPPTSTPTTTQRQRRARTSSGYVWRRLRRTAPTRAWPGRASAPVCASPARVTGLTMVASIACWEPCQSGRPLATTSMRWSCETGTSMFMSARRTFRATRAPASWQTRATARSRGKAREASTRPRLHTQPGGHQAGRGDPDKRMRVAPQAAQV